MVLRQSANQHGDEAQVPANLLQLKEFILKKSGDLLGVAGEYHCQVENISDMVPPFPVSIVMARLVLRNGGSTSVPSLIYSCTKERKL